MNLKLSVCCRYSIGRNQFNWIDVNGKLLYLLQKKEIMGEQIMCKCLYDYLKVKDI